MTIEDVRRERETVHLVQPLFYPLIEGLIYIPIDGEIYFFQGNKRYNTDTVSEVAGCGLCAMGYAIQSIRYETRDIIVDDQTVNVGIYSKDLEGAVNLITYNHF